METIGPYVLHIPVARQYIIFQQVVLTKLRSGPTINKIIDLP